MLFSLSMIKYSWYTVMKCNYERSERIKASTQRIKLLASTTKTFKQSAKDEDQEDITNIVEGQAIEDDDEEDQEEEEEDQQEKEDEGKDDEESESDDELSNID